MSDNLTQSSDDDAAADNSTLIEPQEDEEMLSPATSRFSLHDDCNLVDKQVDVGVVDARRDRYDTDHRVLLTPPGLPNKLENWDKFVDKRARRPVSPVDKTLINTDDPDNIENDAKIILLEKYKYNSTTFDELLLNAKTDEERQLLQSDKEKMQKPFKYWKLKFGPGNSQKNRAYLKKAINAYNEERRRILDRMSAMPRAARNSKVAQPKNDEGSSSSQPNKFTRIGARLTKDDIIAERKKQDDKSLPNKNPNVKKAVEPLQVTKGRQNAGRPASKKRELEKYLTTNKDVKTSPKQTSKKKARLMTPEPPVKEEQNIDMTECEFWHFNYLNSKCNRAGVFAEFLPTDGKVDGIFGDFYLKAVPMVGQSPVDPKKDITFFYNTDLPAIQEECMEYYSIHFDTLSPEAIAGIVDTNEKYLKVFLSIGMSSIIATFNKMMESVGPYVSWHQEFGQTLVNFITHSMRVGHEFPYYPSPPKSWCLLQFNKACNDAEDNNTIFIHERGLPENYPAITNMRWMRGSVRSDFAGLLQFGDLASFLHYQEHDITYRGLLATVTCLCQDSGKSSGFGGFYMHEPNLHLQHYIDVEKNVAELEGLLTERNETQKRLEEVVRHNNLVILISFQPTGKKKFMEVMVICNYEHGELSVFASQQPEGLIKNWHPVPNIKQNQAAKHGLPNLLEMLVRHLNFILPRHGTANGEGWKVPTTFNCNQKLVPKPRHLTTNLNRLILCVYLEMCICCSRDPPAFVNWTVGKKHSPYFMHQSSRMATIKDYVQNYATMGGLNMELNDIVPQRIIGEMFYAENFYDWAIPFIKLKFHDLIFNSLMY